MKNVPAIILSGIIIALVVVFTIPCQAQIQAVGCGSSKGTLPCGAEWDEGDYHCICDCSSIPPAKCTQRSSSNNSSGGSGYSSQTQMMQNILTPVFDRFFKWLFSSPSSEQPRQQQIDNKENDKRWEEEYKKRQEEYKAQVQEQIKYAKGEYQKQIQDQYQEQKEKTIAAFKDKFAVSEAVKAVKQANCAAYNSLQAAESALQGFGDFKELDGTGDFKELDGTMEKARKSAVFASANSSGCPPIKIEIPEVSAARPISFQQLFYGYVEHQSDSIARTIDTLKEKKAANDRVLEEKNQRVEEIKQVVEKKKNEKKQDGTINRQEDDQLLKDAQKELETASRELQTAEEADKKMKEEIEAKEKNILALEKMRKTYDADAKQATPKQQSNK